MSSTPGSVIIVTGPAGAGKTTVSRLVATAFDPGVHLPMDSFEPFIVSGWVDPALADAAGQHRTLGGAVFAAALQFAHGGYTVVVDGHVFPEVLGELAGWIESNGVPLHYVVLRPDLATCLARVGHRRPGDPEDPEGFARLHVRFSDVGRREAHVVDHGGTPAEIAERIVVACSSGRVRVGVD